VLVGHGVGKSSAVDVLLSHLKAHHAELAQRVREVEVVDLSALSEAQIEAVVRRKLSAAT
jgi:ABC-type phosphonate transport system ATPase subunit